MRSFTIFILLMLLVSGAYAAVSIDLDANKATFWNSYGNITLSPFDISYYGEIPPTMDYYQEVCAEQALTVYQVCGIFDYPLVGSASDAAVWRTINEDVTYSYFCPTNSYGKVSNYLYWCYVNGTNISVETTVESWFYNDPGDGATVFWNDTRAYVGWDSLKDKFDYRQVGGRHVYCAEVNATFSAGQCRDVKYTIQPRSSEPEGKWDFYLNTSVGDWLIDPTWSSNTTYPYFVDSTQSVFFTKNSLNASENTTFYVYGGGPNSKSNGSGTFDWYRNVSNAQTDWTNDTYVILNSSGSIMNYSINGSSSYASSGYYDLPNFDITSQSMRMGYIWYAQYNSSGHGHAGLIIDTGAGIHSGAFTPYGNTPYSTYTRVDSGEHALGRSTTDSGGMLFYEQKMNSTSVNATNFDNMGNVIATYNGTDESGTNSILDKWIWYDGTSGGSRPNEVYVSHAFFSKVLTDLSDPICSYGTNESGDWIIDGDEYLWRIQVTCNSTETIAGYAIPLDYSQFNDTNLLVTNESVPDPPTGCTEINSCQALSANTCYVLNASIIDTNTSNCFYSSGNNVTLNLNGSTVSGDGTNTFWIETGGDDNLTVVNGTVANFSVAINFDTLQSTGVTFQNITFINITGNPAFDLDYIDDSTFTNLTIIGSERFAFDTGSNDNILSNSIFENCTTRCFVARGSADGHTVSNNTFHSANLSDDTVRINADNIILNNNIFKNGGLALNILDATGLTGSGNRFYNNTYDLVANYSAAATGFDFDNLIFDRPAGDLTSYTNLSITDTLTSGQAYYLNYSTQPAAPPSDKVGLGFWVEIKKVSGVPTITQLVWHYLQSDVTAAQVGESTLDMYEYTAGWTELTDVLDTGANTLTVTNLVTHSDYGPLGDPDFKVNASVPNANETENKTINYSLVSTVGDITAYDVAFYYNNTLIQDLSVTGISSAAVNLNFSAVAPLVSANLTNIPWAVYVNATIGGTPYSDNDTGNQQVQLWYYPDAYPIAADAAYTVEGRNNFTVTIPSKPASAPEDVAYSRALSFPNCTRVFANTTEVNATCGNTFVNDFMQNFSVLPAHTKVDGLIYSDVWVNRSYTLTFDATNESTSSKVISALDNATREYFVWIVEADNGSIDGADNISTWLNISFYLEADLVPTNASSAVATYTVTFPDGYLKNFTVSYSGTIDNSTVRGYPDFYTAIVSSVEVYSKTDYTTRSRFMTEATVDFSEQQNDSVYFLSDSEASYALIIVHDNGDPVAGAIVHVQKYFANSSLYITVDQKYTNADGKTAAYIEGDAYYHFVVYDNSEIVYASTDPEQFILEDGVYTVSINIAGAQEIDLTSPYIIANCYGNLSANSVTFTYADATGITDTIRFILKNIDTGSVPCNQTITGSSGGYVCSLSAPENLTTYAYTCEVWREASPWWLVLVKFVDERLLTGHDGWVVAAIAMVVCLMAAAVYLPVGLGLMGISLFALDALGITALGYDVTVPIMGVGLVLAFLTARRD